MMIRNALKITLVVLAISLIGTAGGFGADAAPSTLLPEGMDIQETYKPGIGQPIGRITEVRGEAVIIHAEPAGGFRASENLAIYKNDTLVTLDDGHLSFSLNDGSFMALSPRTRLQVNKSVFAPEQKTRSSFVEMGLGRARFVVKKLVDAKHSEFKVKTKTSVAGVRGSDFVIFASEEITEITALTDTILEVVSLATPEAPPLVLTDYEQTRIRKGAPPEEARKIEAQEIERLMREFMVQPPGTSETGSFQEVIETGAADAPGGNAGAAPPPVVAVSQQDLIVPDAAAGALPGANAPLIAPIGIQMPQGESEIQQIRTIQSQVVEKKAETDIVEEAITLPEFPGLPDM